MATLVRVMPDQVNSIWGLVKTAIVETMKTPSEEKVNRVLRSILIGSSQLFAVMKDEEVLAIVITQVVGGDGDRNFLIHTAFYYSRLDPSQLVKIYGQLEKQAKTFACENIVFYTSNEKLCEFVERHGGVVERFVTVPVEHNVLQER